MNSGTEKKKGRGKKGEVKRKGGEGGGGGGGACESMFWVLLSTIGL